MAKIKVGLSPWALGGGLAGGVAEGAYMGGTLAEASRRTSIYEEQIKEQAKQQELAQYYHMLTAAVKAGETSPQVANALLQQAMAGIKGHGGPPMSMPQFPSLEERQQKDFAAIDKIMKDPSLSPEQKSARMQSIGLKPPAEMIDFTLPDGRVIKLSADKAAQFMQQEMLKEIALAAKGGKGDGESTKGMIPWQGPDGKFLGYAPKNKPPGPNAVPATAASFNPPKDKPEPLKLEEHIANIEKDYKAGNKDAAVASVERLNSLGYGTFTMDKKNGRVRFQSKTPHKGAPAGPPVQKYNAPPPPDEDEE